MDNAFLATPVDLAFGDKTYKMSPLTDKDQSELNQYVQAAYIDNARRSLPDDIDDKTYARLMTLAMKSALGLVWTRQPGKNIFTTEHGLARLMWQGVKRNDKTVTQDELLPFMFKPRCVMEFEQKFLQINFPETMLDYIKSIATAKANGKENGEAEAQSFQQQKNTIE